MAETLVSSRQADDDERLPVTVQRAGDQVVDMAQRARFERELAALDLTDAAQAAARSASAPANDGDVQAEIAARLYASADRHRLTAERLEMEARRRVTLRRARRSG